MELVKGTSGNFISTDLWKQLGKPELQEVSARYESASKHAVPVFGKFVTKAKSLDSGEECSIPFIVSSVPSLNLLGRDAIAALKISLDRIVSAIQESAESDSAVYTVNQCQPDKSLQKACQELCDEFPDLFKPELGCLKDFELEIQFKPDVKPVFCKPRPVPFAVQEDLARAYDAGIAMGIWKPVQFNAYGTPVVPVRKTILPGQVKPKIRVCGDYSVTVNQQLETHRHPLPLPEDLMRKLGGGYGFTKIDLADAYNQIKLGPESQKKLALSTHRGVMLQMRLPYGITSAPGYFQEIMDQLTSDLSGVAVYLVDIQRIQ